MAVTLTPAYVLVLIVSAFALPLVFLAWIRNTKRAARPPIPLVLKAFAWGAVISVIIALVIEYILIGAGEQIEPLYVFLAQHFLDPLTFLAVVLVAPFVEEAAKGVSTKVGRPAVRAIADGLVFGAAAGLGFSATENLIYGLSVVSPTSSAVDPLLVIAVRSFSSSLLHASASAVLGYGLAKTWLTGRRYAYLPYYLLAVVIHGGYNFLGSLGQLYSLQFADVIGFVAAIVVAVTAVTVVRYRLVARHPSPRGEP